MQHLVQQSYALLGLLVLTGSVLLLKIPVRRLLNASPLSSV